MAQSLKFVMEVRNPEEWSVREVCEWLSSLELSKYKTKFEEMGIDGSLLYEITDHDLKSDMGIDVRLHRIKILENIKRLKDREEQNVSQSASEAPMELADYIPNQSELDTNNASSNVHSINVQETVQPIFTDDDRCEVLVLKAIEGGLQNNIYIIGSPGASLGRNSNSNDIIIGESFVSRKHCEIRYDAKSNQFKISDLGSTTGTFVMIRQPMVLKLGMMFQMGLSEFKVTNIKYNPYGKMIEVELQIYEGPSRQNNITVRSEGITIGRDPGNSYSIREDSQMSSYHAKLYLENGNFWLHDVGSTNRTWLRLSPENERSQPHPLIVGDILKIGSTVMLVQVPDISQLLIPKPKQTEPAKNVNEESACKICFNQESNAALYPCGHMFCEYCATKCPNCPICRREIQEIVKLYR